MTYEMQCTGCGHEFEVVQSIGADPIVDCPACQEPHLRRMVSGGEGFVLKGGGWAADGYSSAPASKESASR